MKQRKLDLAVIEGRWSKDGNSSLRGLFDVLSDIQVNHPAAYHYEMFNNSAALKEIVQRTAKRYCNIYIAAHGSSSSISGAEGNRKNDISRTKLKNIIKTTAELKKSRLKGMFFGSCNFIDNRNAKFLLKENTKICWIAGYSESIDFIDSSIVDVFFWNTYYSYSLWYSKKNRRIGKNRIVKMVAEDIDAFMPGAHEELGFNIFLNGKRKIRPLLPIQDDQ